MRTPRQARVAFAVLVVTGLLASVSWLAGPARAEEPVPDPTSSPTASPSPTVQSIRLEYVAWNGTTQLATLLLPLGYGPEEAPPLPVVIHLHGRGAAPAHASTAWSDLPTRYGFAVICPSSVARDGSGNSWAVPGQVGDILRMPDVVESAVPWLQLDRERQYLAGSSMGGQEALVALARAPDQFAAVAVFDGAADLAARYWEMGSTGQLRDQAKLRHELQGTPRQRPFAYVQRSPLSYAETLARCRVPLRVTWSTTDKIVVNGRRTQFGRLCRRLRALDPQVPLTEVVTTMPHGQALRADPEAVVRFFAPDGVWLVRSGVAPADWSYVGWQQRAEVWHHQIEVPGTPGDRLWKVRFRDDGLTVRAPAYMRLRLPWDDDGLPVTVTVDGIARRVLPRDGTLTVSLLAGSHTVSLGR